MKRDRASLRIGGSVRGAIAGSLVPLALLGTCGWASAQPSSTSICDLPGMRGTSAYNKYCTGGAPTVVQQAPAYDPLRSFPAVIAASAGEVHVVKSGGRAFTAEQMKGERFEFGDVLVTGPSGSIQILLPDETVFTVGPNGEIDIDEFIYDPANGRNTLNTTIIKGLFRFVTGKVSTNRDLNVKVAIGSIGVRGTDIEFNELPDGSGYVKLFSGVADLTPYDTDTTISLQPGQMITWTDFTKFSDPRPIE